MSATPSMTAQITEFRRHKDSVVRDYRAQPYPRTVREHALRVRRVLVDCGHSERDVALRLGLRIETLRRWVQADHQAAAPAAPSAPQPTLLPVTLLSAVRVPEPSTAQRAVTLVSPDGWRIEGLALDQLVELVGQLTTAR